MEMVRDDSAIDRRTDGQVWRARLRRLVRDQPDDRVRVRPTAGASLTMLAVSWLATALVVGLCLVEGFAPEDWGSAFIAIVMGMGFALHESDPRRVRRPEDLPRAPEHAETIGASWRVALAAIVLGVLALAGAHALWPSAVMFHASFLVVLTAATLMKSAIALRVWHWERRHPDQQVVSVLGDPGWLAVRPRPRDDRSEAEAAFGR